jgi:hypothetical protein
VSDVLSLQIKYQQNNTPSSLALKLPDMDCMLDQASKLHFLDEPTSKEQQPLEQSLQGKRENYQKTVGRD